MSKQTNTPKLLQPKQAYTYSPKELTDSMQKLRDEHDLNTRLDDHLEAKTCAGCGEQFYANRNDGDYCCYEHSDGHWHGSPEGAGAERIVAAKTAADPIAAQPVETSEHIVDATAEVMDYCRRHRDEVYVSDKEVPETFRDLRMMDGEVDPGYFLVPPLLSGSQQQTNSVTQSNYRVYIKRYGGVEGLFQIFGDKGSFAIAIRISAISAAMLDDLISLDTYPAADEEDAAKVEHERIDEAWNDWARYDFVRALEEKFPEQEEMIDGLDEDQTRLVFDLVRKRLGVEWAEDSSSMFIDVNQIAEAVTEADFTPTLVKKAKGGPTRAPGVSSHNLFTADQVLKVYSRAGVTSDILPKRHGQPLMVSMPGEDVTVRITKSDHKSTYDKPLWLCEHMPV